jgi:NADH:ubiquinone oxidoreductase subunit K
MEVTLMHYLVLSSVMFGLGIIGFITRRNMVTVLMCIELMLNAVNINFIAFAKYSQLMSGQVMALFIITIAAAEAAVGLAIIIVLFRSRRSINIDDVNILKY